MNLARSLSGALALTAATATVLATTAPALAAAPSDPPWSPQHRARAAATVGAASSHIIPGATSIVRDGITLLHLRTSVNTKPAKGSGATRSDFDGDARDDIAAFSHGGVVVTYSSAPVRDRLATEMPGGGCVCFGTPMVTGNFNGDKYDDLAIGDPGEVDLKAMGYSAGAVWIFLGGPGGLRVDAVKHINQATSAVPGTSARGDGFGRALAAGDITGDGRDELLVGVPGKTISGKKEAGVVVALKGSASGVVTSGAKWIHQNSAGVPGSAEKGDHFGWAIAIGKINKDKYRDVVIGAAHEDDGTGNGGGSGAVTQFWGSSTGPSLKKVTTVYGQSTSAAAEKKDAVLWYLGELLAIGDTTGDGYGEVIIGASSAQANWQVYGGVVVTLPGRSTGLSTKGMILLSQRDNDIAGSAEDSDRFGDSIAVGDLTGDGRADVLVGVPGEDIGKAVDAGTVVLLRGSKKGLTGAKSQTLTQSSTGVPDSAERGDHFGAAVAVLNLNGAKVMDAAIGSPGELVPGDPAGYSSGTVTRMYGGSKGLFGGIAVSGRSVGVETQSYGYLAHQ